MTRPGGGIRFVILYSWQDLFAGKVIWLTIFTGLLFVVLGMAMAFMVIVPESMDTRRKLELEKKPNARTLVFGPPVISNSREDADKTWTEVANLMKQLKPELARDVIFAKSIQLHWKRDGSEGLESLKGRVVNPESEICLRGEKLVDGTSIDSAQRILVQENDSKATLPVLVSTDFCRLIRCSVQVGTEISFSFPGILSRAGMIRCRIAGILNGSRGSDGLYFFSESSFAMRKALAIQQMREQSWTASRVEMKGLTIDEWYELARNPKLKKLLSQQRIGDPSSAGKPELIFATRGGEGVARDWWLGSFLKTVQELRTDKKIVLDRIGALQEIFEDDRDVIQADVILEVYANSVKNLQDIEGKYEHFVAEKLQPSDPKVLGLSKLELPEIRNVEVIRQVEEIEKAADAMRFFVGVLIVASILLFAATAGFLLGIRSDYKKNELGLLRMLGLNENMMYCIIGIQSIGLSLGGFLFGALFGIAIVVVLGERAIEGISAAHFYKTWPWLFMGLCCSVIVTVFGALLGGKSAATNSPASLVNS